MARVALTGASGFVGGAAALALQAAGHEVVGLTRQPGGLAPGIEEVVGDLADAHAVRRLVAGADAVVHAAGLVRSADHGALHRTNVDGTRAVVHAAERVGRLVHVSTAGVHGRPGTVVDEGSAIAPENAYESSKAVAETTVRSMRADAVVLRPTNVLGVGHPRDPLLRFLQAAGAGHVVTTPHARTNYVSVTDVAAGVVEAVAAAVPPAVRILNEGRSVVALASTAASLLGAPDRVRILPSSVGRLVGPVSGAVRRWAPRLGRWTSPFDTTAFESRVRDACEPDGLDQALAAMVADYRARGLL